MRDVPGRRAVEGDGGAAEVGPDRRSSRRRRRWPPAAESRPAMSVAGPNSMLAAAASTRRRQSPLKRTTAAPRETRPPNRPLTSTTPPPALRSPSALPSMVTTRSGRPYRPADGRIDVDLRAGRIDPAGGAGDGHARAGGPDLAAVADDLDDAIRPRRPQVLRLAGDHACGKRRDRRRPSAMPTARPESRVTPIPTPSGSGASAPFGPSATIARRRRRADAQTWMTRP